MTSTHVYANFAGRRRKFELTIGAASELEKRCGAGVGEILLRLGSHHFTVDDVVQSIQLGLEGGGTSEAEATALGQRHIKPPLSSHLQLAIDIVAAFINGVPQNDGDEEKKSPEIDNPPEPMPP
ncbi:MAG: gene transfer agent family protein, partial [Rhizobiales bacterium]|nr:gene transfer agent family protein [Hyphomicrobiales bacterium]